MPSSDKFRDYRLGLSEFQVIIVCIVLETSFDSKKILHGRESFKCLCMNFSARIAAL